MSEQAIKISGFAEIDKTKICYYKDHDGDWHLWLPDCGLGNLANHEVTEHQDGTITVLPSILVSGTNERHGYLTKGVWSEC